MQKKTILSVFGTRPEAIKMAPLVKALRSDSRFNSLVCVTAQHREMLDQVMSIFDITADYDLNIMKHGQTLDSITTDALQGVSKVISKVSPDLVLVHGDTTTAFSSALAAFYNQVPVGHVEAGLRTHDIYSPFPEEMNRTLIGRIAKLHFAPTEMNAKALRNESVQGKIIVTGNTVIDALQSTVRSGYRFQDDQLKNVQHEFENRRVILLTAHRRENIGQYLDNICSAIRTIIETHEDVVLVCPVHPNPAVKKAILNKLADLPRVFLTDPLSVSDMHNLMNLSFIVLTDSGGLQEEAPALGKPVIVLRETTERQEAIDAGTVMMGGVETQNIVNCTSMLLNDEKAYAKMSMTINPYGDGTASKRIVESLHAYFDECEQEENQHA